MSIGIMGALQEEVSLFLEEADIQEVRQIAGIQFVEGILAEKKVVVCRSGVGKVNTAMCTQLLLDHFDVSQVVFTGVAGALDPKLEIGDVVVSRDCMQHDIDASALGFRRGEIPYAACSVFTADEELSRLAAHAAQEISGGQVLKGRVLSGDQFIANREVVKRLYTEMGGHCVEMEGAAMAQVCNLNRVPYVVIRSISDRADGSAHVNYTEFVAQAAEQSYQIVRRLVGAILR